ncbi:SusD/RagB family nutrient-binding outer membrane lipoprotein [Tenacibaculum finnmarkense]|uniref:SusD/RagB family nutrient-binding outer membrane lipoprotein n=1 Tax=Tenacibaculum finnmarkense TaxID=2781243 RepID=UPI001E515583|nr:SusD/RagB family nutrient-binding outer membrane lipoprotein [Tenacibaculum finnmarkense]MCD8409248.1 SusD/RagB family nutrient-binding outer membrane lipoprotein [Tenacibaculum finnmarkense genomovar ulcerans]
MNNTIKYISGMILSSTLILTSCTDGFEEANFDKKSPITVAPKYLLATAQTQLMNHYMNVDGQTNATAVQAQFFSESAYPSASLFDFSDNLEDRYMQGYYTPTLALSQIQNSIKNTPTTIISEEEKKGWKLITTTLTAFAMQNATDANGPAMYSDAFNLENKTPKYDSQEAIYTSLLKDLYAASSGIDVSTSFSDSDMTSQDIIFQGDFSKWQKFANSIMLRLAMRISDVAPAISKEYFNKAVNENGGVFTSSADNAIFQYLTSPNGSAWYETSTISRFPELAGSNTIIDIQNATNDPRKSIYWGGSTNPGLEYGKTFSSYSGKGKWDFPYVNQNYAGVGYWSWGKQDTPGIFIDYAEVEFFLAEAVVRGGYAVTGTAKEHYNKAIEASINFQAGIVEWDQADIDTAVTDYLAETTVDFDNATDKLKQIGREKWVALFFQGPEAWAEARRLDSPIMNIPSKKTAADLPVRLKFSTNERIVNSSNINEATKLLGAGGDEYTTKLWWDVK